MALPASPPVRGSWFRALYSGISPHSFQLPTTRPDAQGAPGRRSCGRAPLNHGVMAWKLICICHFCRILSQRRLQDRAWEGNRPSSMRAQGLQRPLPGGFPAQFSFIDLEVLVHACAAKKDAALHIGLPVWMWWAAEIGVGR